MDVFEFVASLVNSLTWPVVVLLSVILLREQIRDIFSRLSDRIKSLKTLTGPGGTSAQFEDGVLGAKQEVDEITKPDTPGPSDGLVTDDAYKLAAASPRAAIIESWIVLEAALRRWHNAISKRKNRANLPTSLVIKGLREANPDNDTIDAVATLFRLRAQAVHDRDFAITPLAATEFAESAYRMASSINSALNQVDGVDDDNS